MDQVPSTSDGVQRRGREKRGEGKNQLCNGGEGDTQRGFPEETVPLLDLVKGIRVIGWDRPSLATGHSRAMPPPETSVRGVCLGGDQKDGLSGVCHGHS